MLMQKLQEAFAQIGRDIGSLIKRVGKHDVDINQLQQDLKSFKEKVSFPVPYIVSDFSKVWKGDVPTFDNIGTDTSPTGTAAQIERSRSGVGGAYIEVSVNTRISKIELMPLSYSNWGRPFVEGITITILPQNGHVYVGNIVVNSSHYNPKTNKYTINVPDFGIVSKVRISRPDYLGIGRFRIFRNGLQI